MKRRIIAALMALCLCIGLLPATALAVGEDQTGQATTYVNFSYNSDLAYGSERTVVLKIVDSSTNAVLGQTTYPDVKNNINTIEVRLLEATEGTYDIESVDVDHGSVTSDELSANSYSFLWTYAEYINPETTTITVYLCPEFKAPYLPDGEIENLNLTRTYRIYPTQVLKMLRALNADISPDTQIVDIKPIWVKSFAEDDKSFSDVNVESDYGSLIVTSSDGKVDTVQPTNLRKLEITYNNGGDNKTVEVYSKDLRCTIEGTISQYYNIEWNDDSFHIVYFYNETDGNAGNNYFPYAIRFVDDGETLGDQMPADPTYQDSLYQFVNWEQNDWDGDGMPFLSTTIVNDDLTVFARKMSSTSGGTEIHISNESNQLFDRVAELFNEESQSDPELSAGDIQKDSVQIVVRDSGNNATDKGGDGDRWMLVNDDWYLVYSTYGLDHIDFTHIESIDVYFKVAGSDEEHKVSIPVGEYPGDISVRMSDTENVVDLLVNGPEVLPRPEDPDPEPGDDYAITDVTKTLVDTAEKAEAAGISGEYDYPDPVNGNKVIIPEDDTVTLLYAITVEGKPGASFTVTDKDATLVAIDSVAITQTDDTFTGSIPAGATSITFYVSKTFDADDLENASEGDGTVLKNTANVAGENAGDADPDEDEDTEETPAEEEDPTKPDFDADDLAGVTVQVLCVQNPTGHTYKTTLKDAPSTAYKTSIESYEGSFSDWKCTVSINTDVFVGLFNSKAAEASWGTHAFSYATPDELVFYYTEASGWLCASDPTFTISVTEQKSQYTLTYDANGGVFFPPDELVERTTNSVTLAPGEYTLDKVAGYLEPIPYFNGQGEKVLFAGWTMKEPEEKGKVYHYNDSDIPEIEETVTITDQPVTVYAVWSYDENDDEEADINQIVVKPADITIYMGGTGYEGTVDASGNIITSTDGAGLPEPGFIVTLPASAPANTVITDLVFEEADGGDRTWRFETYDGQADTVVYKLVPQGDEQTATRVRFTKADGTVIVSDEFTVGLEVNTSFTMALYKGSGATAVGKIVADIGGKSYSVNSDPTGTLTVRGTTDGAQYAGMTPEETRSLPEEGKPAVMAPVGTTYAINGGDVQVQDSSGVALLFDAIIDHADEDRTELLQKRAEAYFTDKDVEPETGNKFAYEFKYLDLVDQNNGNVWVKASNDVTIYWPLPEGADTNTLKVLHFKDLHREMATADIESQIEQCDVEAIDVEVVGSHVTFKIGSSGFSPFALVWQEKDGTTPAQYTVTYHENFGSSTDTRQNDFAAGTQVTVITNPFGGHSNYAFDGWNTRADGNGTSYDPGDPLTVTGNITLYAQWRYTGGGEYNPKDATLRFNSRGGTEFEDEVRDAPFNFNPYENIPSRPGYRFTGWYDSSRLDDRYDEDEEIFVRMGTTTVWAGWEETSVPSMLNGDDHYAYIQGYSDGTVRPNANITRAQVATIFFRLLDEDVRDDNLTTYNTFPDVDEDYWANTAISTMASLGVINGRNSGLFDPDAYITRAEFAAICARFDDSGVDGITTFTDTVGHWAEDEISRAAALGWIQGYSDGTFRPNQYITRAQAVTMINRVLCRLPEDTDDLLSGMNTWTDCHEDDWFYLAIQEATNSHDFVAKDRVYESWTDLNRAPDWSRYE